MCIEITYLVKKLDFYIKISNRFQERLRFQKDSHFLFLYFFQSKRVLVATLSLIQTIFSRPIFELQDESKLPKVAICCRNDFSRACKVQQTWSLPFFFFFRLITRNRPYFVRWQLSARVASIHLSIGVGYLITVRYIQCLSLSLSFLSSPLFFSLLFSSLSILKLTCVGQDAL